MNQALTRITLAIKPRPGKMRFTRVRGSTVQYFPLEVTKMESASVKGIGSETEFDIRIYR